MEMHRKHIAGVTDQGLRGDLSAEHSFREFHPRDRDTRMMAADRCGTREDWDGAQGAGPLLFPFRPPSFSGPETSAALPSLS